MMNKLGDRIKSFLAAVTLGDMRKEGMYVTPNVGAGDVTFTIGKFVDAVKAGQGQYGYTNNLMHMGSVTLDTKDLLELKTWLNNMDLE